MRQFPHFPDFFVTARNTVFTYRGDGSGHDVRVIGHDFNAPYVLEGTVRSMGETTSDPGHAQWSTLLSFWTVAAG